MRAIYRRELQGYFFSSIGYVFIGVFLLLGSVFFIVGNLAARSTSMLSLLSNMSYLWMLLSPVLTMRLLTKDQQGDKLLFSAPVSLFSIVLGKYLAACTVLLAATVLSLVYPCLIAVYGRLYIKETMVGYLGFVLEGCSFLALDLFISCFARSQVVSVIAAFGVNLLLWLSGVLAQAISSPVLSSILSFINLYDRVSPFLSGQLSFSNMLYGVSFIAVMLFLCIRVLDARRWSEV